MYSDYYRLVVRNEDESRVLMVEEDGIWDLPYFEFKPPSSANLKRSVDYLQELLGFDAADQCLTPIAPIQRLLADRGRRCGHLKWQQDMFGYAHLVLLDCNMDMSTLKLPENYKWQDSEFVKGMSVPEKYDENIEWMLKKTAQVLDKDEWITKMLWQPQHRTGWFPKASKWLEECVRKDGGKVVGRVSVFSSVGSVEHPDGKFGQGILLLEGGFYRK